MIVAMDLDHGIGKNGTLPWQFKADLAYFKRVTTAPLVPGKTNGIVMGRKTWESLPKKPLPNRVHVVLTRSDLKLDGAKVFSSLDSVLKEISSEVGALFVIGGGQVFKKAIHHPHCQRILVTQIGGYFDCDVFFPVIPSFFGNPKVVGTVEENDTVLTFLDYQKI